jgi:hypothetical protein
MDIPNPSWASVETTRIVLGDKQTATADVNQNHPNTNARFDANYEGCNFVTWPSSI